MYFVLESLSIYSKIEQMVWRVPTYLSPSSPPVLMGPITVVPLLQCQGTGSSMPLLTELPIFFGFHQFPILSLFRDPV